MELSAIAYQIAPLGDTALLINFENIIDEHINKEVIRRAAQLKKHLPYIIEVVPAYSSIIISFDIVKWKKKITDNKLVYERVKEAVEQLLAQPFAAEEEERLLKIPVCYEKPFSADIDSVASLNNITIDEVVTLHLSRQYRVYMLGFLPGFSYLGEVNEKIAMPRKKAPQLVAAGSIGIAGKQTGIYPLASPGGWQIIGRTPVKLFDKKNSQPVLLKAGDKVEFFSITTTVFNEMQNTILTGEGAGGET